MSVCANFQLPILARRGLKVPGGVEVGWGGWVVWLQPILVFSLSLSQAEQFFLIAPKEVHGNCKRNVGSSPRTLYKYKSQIC